MTSGEGSRQQEDRDRGRSPGRRAGPGICKGSQDEDGSGLGAGQRGANGRMDITWESATWTRRETMGTTPPVGERS